MEQHQSMLYQPVIVVPPWQAETLVTLFQDTYPQESQHGSIGTPYIALFHPVQLGSLEDMGLLLHEWGPFSVTILGHWLLESSTEGDHVFCPVESQDCMYINHILSRFIDTIPDYKSYIPRCFLGTILKGYGMSLGSHLYKPVTFTAETVTFLEIPSCRMTHSLSLHPTPPEGI